MIAKGKLVVLALLVSFIPMLECAAAPLPITQRSQLVAYQAETGDDSSPFSATARPLGFNRPTEMDVSGEHAEAALDAGTGDESHPFSATARPLGFNRPTEMDVSGEHAEAALDH